MLPTAFSDPPVTSDLCSALTPDFHYFGPLSSFRALFLSYLAFSSLSLNNLFYLLSPPITPFLIIVSIPLFVCVGGFFHLTEAGEGGPCSALGLPLQL